MQIFIININEYTQAAPVKTLIENYNSGTLRLWSLKYFK